MMPLLRQAMKVPKLKFIFPHPILWQHYWGIHTLYNAERKTSPVMNVVWALKKHEWVVQHTIPCPSGNWQAHAPLSMILQWTLISCNCNSEPAHIKAKGQCSSWHHDQVEYWTESHHISKNKGRQPEPEWETWKQMDWPCQTCQTITWVHMIDPMDWDSKKAKLNQLGTVCEQVLLSDHQCPSLSLLSDFTM